MSGTIDGNLSLMAWAASSDSQTTIPTPLYHLLAQMALGSSCVVFDRDLGDDCVHWCLLVRFAGRSYPRSRGAMSATEKLREALSDQRYRRVPFRRCVGAVHGQRP
jgi:hypothetical protein